MKKLLVVLTLLCLIFSMVAMAEGEPFDFRNGVKFGMTQAEVTATEGNVRYEVDTEHTHGPVTFTEVEYENVSDDSVKGDVTYMFIDGKLVAVHVDFYRKNNTFEDAEKFLTEQYGEGQDLDLSKLGNGVYAVDDDGHPEAKAKAWVADDFAAVLEKDDDGDIDVTYVDLTADYIK